MMIPGARPTVLALALVPWCGVGPSLAQTSPTGAGALFPKAAIGAVIKFCRQGECHATRLDARALLKAGEGSEHYRITETVWQYEADDKAAARAAGKSGGERRESRVICSRRSPSYVFQDEGKWIQHALAPGDPQGYAGYNGLSYTMYFAACHGLVRMNWTAGEARKLGYAARAGEAQQFEWARPDQARGAP